MAYRMKAVRFCMSDGNYWKFILETWKFFEVFLATSTSEGNSARIHSASIILRRYADYANC